MDGATARSGIRRRRGAASASGKSPSTSVIVVLVSFIATSTILLIWLMCMSMPSSTRPRVSSSSKGAAAAFAAKKTKARKRGDDGRVPAVVALDDVGNGGEDDDKFARIVNAELDLVAIDTVGIERVYAEGGGEEGSGSKYRGVRGIFCKLHWDKYKKDPPAFPMFKMLVQESKCDEIENLVSVDLADIARKLDEGETEQESMGIRAMAPAGFVFHESRVGSTLVANALAAMDPSGHRVYSESDPINRALSACEEFTRCDMEANVDLLRDVVFMMGRTSSPDEKKMFFKVSSIGSKRIDVMRQAFEYVPWLFVYRDPVQTMMSHMDPTKMKRTVRGGQPPAVCLRSRRSPPEDLRRLALRYDSGKRVEELSDEEFCAAHLATLCESALQQMNLSHQGAAVEYEGLVDKLIGEVFPKHFTIDIDDAARERILDVSKIYSKSNGRDLDWKDDSERKDTRATPEIVLASKKYLDRSYTDLAKHCIYNRDWHYVYT